MKNTKLMIKFFLVIALFASNVLADGQINTGGLTDDGQINTGGKTCNPQTQTCVIVQPTNNDDDTDKENSIFTFVTEFLASLLG